MAQRIILCAIIPLISADTGSGEELAPRHSERWEVTVATARTVAGVGVAAPELLAAGRCKTAGNWRFLDKRRTNIPYGDLELLNLAVDSSQCKRFELRRTATRNE
jgi:hypothetical protein